MIYVDVTRSWNALHPKFDELPIVDGQFKMNFEMFLADEKIIVEKIQDFQRAF